MAAIDAGGTRTRFELCDACGRVIAASESGTCHPAQVGIPAMAHDLREGVEEVSRKAGVGLEDVAVSIGLAGFGPGREAPLRDALEAAFDDAAALVVTSDAEIARIGALDGADGVLVVAGTGSIAVASFDGQPVRAGGWGWPVGDEGSGAWLGREAVRMCLRQFDGREAPSPLLADAVCRALRADGAEGLVGLVACAPDQRRFLAQAAPAVFDAARAGDKAACHLVAQGASELAQLARCAARGHSGALVSWAGGLFSAGSVLLGPFLAALDSDLVPAPPSGSPLDGARIAAVRALDL
ncbi:BadF/BadG/BcrA/BcrD ATPase family protein [Atopobiaceae bacterium 24-176]